MELIRGGLAPHGIGAVTIEVVAPNSDDAARAVDAVLVEEDRYVMLSAAARVDLRDASNKLRTLTNGFASEPAELGTLILRQGRPLEMLAVVIDIDAQTQVERAHVERAYQRAFAMCVAQSLRTLRTPLLGTRAHFSALESAAALASAARALESAAPIRVVVVCAADLHDGVRTCFSAAQNSRS